MDPNEPTYLALDGSAMCEECHTRIEEEKRRPRREAQGVQ
jgi:hypothetical protein